MTGSYPPAASSRGPHRLWHQGIWLFPHRVRGKVPCQPIVEKEREEYFQSTARPAVAQQSVLSIRVNGKDRMMASIDGTDNVKHVVPK